MSQATSPDHTDTGITQLVDQLKAGEITKSQMFQELATLQPPAPGDPAPTPTRASDRRSLIRQLIQEKTGTSIPPPEQLRQPPVDSPSSDHIQQLQLLPPPEPDDNQHQQQPLDLGHQSTYLRPTNSLDAEFYSRSNIRDYSNLMHDIDLHEGIPEIRELPRQYGARKDADVPFHDRMLRWKHRKESVQHQMKEEKQSSEMDQCSFKPTLNKKSLKVAKKKRQNDSVHISERLYREADRYAIRDQLALAEQQRREEEHARNCTFQPQINRSSSQSSSITRSRYLQPREPPKPLEVHPDLEKCTFTPKINKIPKNMESAKYYVQTNIFERLSGAVSPRSNDSLENPDLFSLADAGPPMYAGLAAEPILSPPAPAPVATKVPVQFDEFLERQEKKKRMKERNLESTKKALESKHQPEINTKSIKIIKSKRSGDFLERNKKYSMHREEKAIQERWRAKDRECTFRPKINKESATREARSATEMSRGDMLKRETTHRFLKLKLDQEEMRTLTFHPKTNSGGPKVEGKLKVLSEPDTYIERIQLQTEMYSEKQRQAMQEQDMQEFEECTFKPQTHDAPAFVKSIAKSMALTKAVRAAAQPQSPTRPDWR